MKMMFFPFLVEDHYGKSGDPYSNSISFHHHNHLHVPQSTKTSQSADPPPPKFMERPAMSSGERETDSHNNHQTPAAQDRSDVFYPHQLPVPSPYHQPHQPRSRQQYLPQRHHTFSHRTGWLPPPHSRTRTKGHTSYEGGDFAYRKSHRGKSEKGK